MIEYKIYYFNRLCLSVRSIAHNVIGLCEGKGLEALNFKLSTND